MPRKSKTQKKKTSENTLEKINLNYYIDANYIVHDPVEAEKNGIKLEYRSINTLCSQKKEKHKAAYKKLYPFHINTFEILFNVENVPESQIKMMTITQIYNFNKGDVKAAKNGVSAQMKYRASLMKKCVDKSYMTYYFDENLFIHDKNEVKNNKIKAKAKSIITVCSRKQDSKFKAAYEKLYLFDMNTLRIVFGQKYNKENVISATFLQIGVFCKADAKKAMISVEEQMEYRKLFKSKHKPVNDDSEDIKNENSNLDLSSEILLEVSEKNRNTMIETTQAESSIIVGDEKIFEDYEFNVELDLPELELEAKVNDVQYNFITEGQRTSNKSHKRKSENLENPHKFFSTTDKNTKISKNNEENQEYKNSK